MIPIRFITVLLALSGTAPAAITVHECVDEDGERVFMDHCPPDMTSASTIQLPSSRREEYVDIGAIAQTHPVTLYSAPDCEACDLVRNDLSRRGVPFAERLATPERTDIHEELQNLTGGMTVPVTLVGGEMLRGYDRGALKGVLDRAGYPSPATAAAAGIIGGPVPEPEVEPESEVDTEWSPEMEPPPEVSSEDEF